MSNGIIEVVGIRSPIKVFKIVVLRIAVAVQSKQAVRSRPDKRLKDRHMYPLLPTIRQGYKQVSGAPLPPWAEHFPGVLSNKLAGIAGLFNGAYARRAVMQF